MGRSGVTVGNALGLTVSLQLFLITKPGDPPVLTDYHSIRSGLYRLDHSCGVIRALVLHNAMPCHAQKQAVPGNNNSFLNEQRPLYWAWRFGC